MPRALPPRLLSGVVLVSALTLTACFESRPESLIPDLRYVSAQVEPPEVEPGDPIDVRWELAHPGRDGDILEYILVMCSQIEGFGDCLEFGDLALNPDYVSEEGNITPEGYHAFFQPTTGFVVRGQTTAGTLEFSGATQLRTALTLQLVLESSDPNAPAPPADLPTFPELEGTLYLLACADELCKPFFDQVDAYIAGGPESGDGEALLEAINSADVLADLPMEGTALANMRYVMSLRAEEARNQNPAIAEVLVGGVTPEDGVIQVAPGTQIDVEVLVSDDIFEEYVPVDSEDGVPAREHIVARWFSTLGVFTPESEEREDAQAPFDTTFTAPAETGDGWIWATLEDERFGNDYRAFRLEVR